MLKFVSLDKKMPEKRDATLRREDFQEIYDEFSSQKAKEQAHSAYHLRQQMKSLSKELAEAKKEQRHQLNERQYQLREQIRELDEKRQATAKKTNASNDNTTPKASENSNAHQQFYGQLRNVVVGSLCREADALSSLNTNETISVIFVGGGRTEQTKTNVIMFNKQKLDDCYFYLTSK